MTLSNFSTIFIFRIQCHSKRHQCLKQFEHRQIHTKIAEKENSIKDKRNNDVNQKQQSKKRMKSKSRKLTFHISRISATFFKLQL